MSRILLASSETGSAGILKKVLKTEGYKPVTASTLAEARELLETEAFNLIVYDTARSWDPELQLLSLAGEKKPGVPVIVMVDPSDNELASDVEGFQPYALLNKPLRIDELTEKVQQAVDFRDSTLDESVNLNLQLESVYRFGEIVAESQSLKSVCDMVNRVAATEVPVLIAGESGTGKKLLASVIHKQSRRKSGPCEVINCEDQDHAGRILARGNKSPAFEAAEGGTLVLDKVHKLHADLQSELARQLKDGISARSAGNSLQLDARIIATVTGSPEKLVQLGSLDPELYKFLRIIFIRIPPLRERPEDILATARHILRQRATSESGLPSIEPAAIRVLENYAWPENVTELARTLNAALEAAKEPCHISVDCLPDYIKGQ
jgi:DNA-binding NtrC family response regulator